MTGKKKKRMGFGTKLTLVLTVLILAVYGYVMLRLSRGI